MTVQELMDKLGAIPPEDRHKEIVSIDHEGNILDVSGIGSAEVDSYGDLQDSHSHTLGDTITIRIGV